MVKKGKKASIPASFKKPEKSMDISSSFDIDNFHDYVEQEKGPVNWEDTLAYKELKRMKN